MIQITDSMLGAFASASLYSKEGKGFEATVIAKFFMPFTSAVWLVTEAERQGMGIGFSLGIAISLNGNGGISPFLRLRNWNCTGLRLRWIVNCRRVRRSGIV